MSASAVQLTLFTDPGCPWGYSANPDLTALQWRYGSGLRWKHVMIGLAETNERYLAAGYSPTRMVRNYRSHQQRFGMPFQAAPRERVLATGRACRAVVATRLLAPALEYAALRALQFGWFTTDALLDEDAVIAEALGLVDGLDAAAIIRHLDHEETEQAYQRDRAQTRTAAGGATSFQNKTANTDGAERFTAPSVLLTSGTGQTLEAGGFQSLAVYDALIANLDRTLARRGPAESAQEVLEAFPQGVTTQEVAVVMAPSLTEPDRGASELALLELFAAGQARRTALADDALWRLA